MSLRRRWRQPVVTGKMPHAAFHEQKEGRAIAVICTAQIYLYVSPRGNDIRRTKPRQSTELETPNGKYFRRIVLPRAKAARRECPAFNYVHSRGQRSGHLLQPLLVYESRDEWPAALYNDGTDSWSTLANITRGAICGHPHRRSFSATVGDGASSRHTTAAPIDRYVKLLEY